MSQFDLNLLAETKKSLEKKAFVPSPQTQQAAAEAQQAGMIPPPAPGPGQTDPNQPQIGFPELASLIQQGFEAVLGGQQQIAQLVQQLSATVQQMAATGAGGKAKKPSAEERLTKLEQMLQQQGGGAPAPAPDAGQGAPPPADPAAGGQPAA